MKTSHSTGTQTRSTHSAHVCHVCPAAVCRHPASPSLWLLHVPGTRRRREQGSRRAEVSHEVCTPAGRMSGCEDTPRQAPAAARKAEAGFGGDTKGLLHCTAQHRPSLGLRASDGRALPLCEHVARFPMATCLVSLLYSHTP